MIGTAISSTARARRDPGRQQAGRRVTFLAGPQHGQHGKSATSAGVSSFFSHVVPDSAARARTIPLSQHLKSVTYGESPYPTTTTATAAATAAAAAATQEEEEEEEEEEVLWQVVTPAEARGQRTTPQGLLLRGVALQGVPRQRRITLRLERRLQRRGATPALP